MLLNSFILFVKLLKLNIENHYSFQCTMGNDRRHGGYNRSSNNDCEIFISRLIPETTTRDVINYVKPRLNRTVRVKQLRAKYDGYASFVLYVPKYLKNKIIDKAFWETDSIYVREFVQKSRL